MAEDGLTIRVEQLERDMERETDKRETALKYVHRLLEDVQSRYQDVSNIFSRLEGSFRQHLEDDKKMGEGIGDLNARLRTIERLVWIAIGGIIVIGGILGFLGSHVIRIVS